MLLLPEILLSVGILLLILVSCLSTFQQHIRFSIVVLFITLVASIGTGVGIEQHWLMTLLHK